MYCFWNCFKFCYPILVFFEWLVHLRLGIWKRNKQVDAKCQIQYDRLIFLTVGRAVYNTIIENQEVIVNCNKCGRLLTSTPLSRQITFVTSLKHLDSYNF